MFAKPYLALLLLAMVVLAGCGGPAPTAAPPFARFTAEDVLTAFVRAGLPVQNIEENFDVNRSDFPINFSDRRVFEIPSIAPNGGQIVVFSRPDALAEWRELIDARLDSSDTRRDVIYTYYNGNVLLQLNANLLPSVAGQYRDAFLAMGSE